MIVPAIILTVTVITGVMLSAGLVLIVGNREANNDLVRLHPKE